jgi:hypothetical protein
MERTLCNIDRMEDVRAPVCIELSKSMILEVGSRGRNARNEHGLVD